MVPMVFEPLKFDCTCNKLITAGKRADDKTMYSANDRVDATSRNYTRRCWGKTQKKVTKSSNAKSLDLQRTMSSQMAQVRDAGIPHKSCSDLIELDYQAIFTIP